MAMTAEETRRLERELIERGGRDLSALKDAFELSRTIDDHERSNEIRKLAREHLQKPGRFEDAMDLYHKTLMYDGPVDFDCFMRALEFNRPTREQFWLPRRQKLMPVCRALQDMEDGKLDELFLSCPPRIGKSTLMMMFFLWVMGRDSERSNLYCSYTDSVVGVLYNGILEVLNDKVTYLYKDIFPGKTVASTNAKDLLINLDRRKRYASFTGRSLYGTLNGACDCDNILIADDLCKGLEQAINKDVMAKLWARTQTDLLSRAKQGSKKLWIGTRWSLIDPIGCRMEMLQNEPKLSHVKWREIRLPALDENDESNFNWKYGIGFDTQTFQGIRAGYERNNDMASWNAVYQQQPIEREGSLFASGDMRFFNGVLPNREPDRCFMAVDPAFGGSDFTAAPVCCQYENDIYVVDVVYTDGDKRESIPLLAKAVQKWHVRTMQIEANKMTEGYAEELQVYMRQNGVYCTVTTKPAPNNMSKEQRIFDRAPEIRESFVFLEHGLRSKPYQQFMDNVFSFTIMKKNKHDDAPDSLAMAASMVFIYVNNFAHTFRRVF